MVYQKEAPARPHGKSQLKGFFFVVRESGTVGLVYIDPKPKVGEDRLVPKVRRTFLGLDPRNHRLVLREELSNSS